MDWSMILGVLGIVVSIAVGWLTYRLAYKRAFSQRYATAKGTVLQELSKSLGEDSVPAPEVLEATIRSVLRETGDPKVDVVVDDVLDDLIRQVTADPFLDSERRRKLQVDIEKVRVQAAEKQRRVPHEHEPEFFLRSHPWSSFSSMLIALITGFFTLALFLVPSAGRSNVDFLGLLQQHPAIIALAIIVLLLFTPLIASEVVERIVRIFRELGRK